MTLSLMARSSHWSTCIDLVSSLIDGEQNVHHVLERRVAPKVCSWAATAATSFPSLVLSGRLSYANAIWLVLMIRALCCAAGSCRVNSACQESAAKTSQQNSPDAGTTLPAPLIAFESSLGQTNLQSLERSIIVI